MNVQIFGTKKCNDTKKAERFFKERGIKFQFIDMKEKGHEPQSMRAALAMHDTFLKKGDMRLTDFGEYLK